MRKYIQAADVANEIRMLRTQHNGCFLITEGDTDARFFGNVTDTANCEIVNAHKKDIAVGALAILEKESFQGVLAIVDADFWVLDGNEQNSINLFLTDTHDLETLILTSPALEKVLAELGSSQKLKRFREQTSKDIREVLLDAGRIVGYLRWISARDTLNLKFEDLTFAKFVDKETMVLDDVRKAIEVTLNHSQRPDLNIDELANEVFSLCNGAFDLWQVCCGHDLVEILALGLRKAIGSRKAQEVDAATVERSLRLAYERSYFTNTRLFQSIRSWEEANRGYTVCCATL